MVEKDEFFQRCRVEFAVSTEFERHLCHAIGLARSVDSESIRFSFCDAYHCVEKRGGDENQCAQNQHKQRKPGGIGDSAALPLLVLILSALVFVASPLLNTV